MQVISQHEAQEYGWQIGLLDDFVPPRFDEEWSDPDPQETIRRITRTQDSRAQWWLRYYLKLRLLGNRPQRNHNPDLKAAIDTALHSYLFGEELIMSFTSNKAARIAAELESRKAANLQHLESMLTLELNKEPISTVVDTITKTLVPKYQHDFSVPDLIKALTAAVARTQFECDDQTAFAHELTNLRSTSDSSWNELAEALNAQVKGQSKEQANSGLALRELGRTRTLIVYAGAAQGHLILARINTPDERIHVHLKMGKFVDTDMALVTTLAGGQRWIPDFTRVLYDFAKKG